MKEGLPVTEKTFSAVASDERIEKTAKALEANGIHALIAKTGAEAKKMFFELVPEGAEVYLGSSVTLEQLGIKEEVDKSGKYEALRPKMQAMNRETQWREIRKLGGTPDYAGGSVHAVTEDGRVVIASKTGSQLGPYASGAGKVIWVVGAQKIVKTLDEAMRRLEEYCVPKEEVHMQELYKTGTGLNKVLIVNREFKPDRITMIIVKEELGF
jgi:L-lactate utilization protein LutC